MLETGITKNTGGSFFQEGSSSLSTYSSLQPPLNQPWEAESNPFHEGYQHHLTLLK